MKLIQLFTQGLLPVFALSCCLTACNRDELPGGDAEKNDELKPLDINVSTGWNTKAILQGSQMPDNSKIGLTILKADGSQYDGGYTNVCYTGSGTPQTWTANPPILLSSTVGTVYAYYPYNVAHNDIAVIPVNVTEDKDVLYSEPAENINNANSTALIKLKHALSVIRFTLTRGSYAGTGNITAIKVKGQGMASSANLNAKSGTFTAYSGKGADISFGATPTLPATGSTVVNQLVIPTGTTGVMEVTVTIDGLTYKTTTGTSLQPSAQNVYNFVLTFNDQAMSMSSVSIIPRSEEDVDISDPVIVP